MSTTAIIGIGNEYRGDDGVGRLVARRLAELITEGAAVYESSGEALSLMDLWQRASTVILVDATEATSAAGAVHRLDASKEALPSTIFPASTHAFSVAEAIELARSLDRLPETVIVYAIEGAAFGHGIGLTPKAERGAWEAGERILQELHHRREERDRQARRPSRAGIPGSSEDSVLNRRQQPPARRP